MRLATLAFLTVVCCSPALSAEVLSVMDFGAKADGVTNDAAAIQKAIDAAAAAGGGVVLLPPGNYLTGTIHLKSNVTLRISSGATVWASKQVRDYEPRHLIYALDAHNITIEGNGLINGNGEAWWDKRTTRFYRPLRGRPTPLIELVSCRNVRIRDVTILQPPGWTIHPLECDGVNIRGVAIIADTRGPNTDGIDVDSSRNVSISDCYIETGDDAIVIKTTGRRGSEVKPSENIAVTNCVLTTTCNNFKMGTESLGDFRNVTVSNCALFRKEGTFQGPISGLAIEMVDGATLDGVVITNISMRDVDTPIFIRLGNRGRGMTTPVPGKLRNVSISNVVATGGILASSITGLPGHPVEGVSLSNISITMKGGESELGGLDVPEYPAKYPEAKMFGRLPAYGFFVRHVTGLALDNIRLGWEKEDARPGLIFDDVQDLEIDGLQVVKAVGEEPLVWFNQVARALLRGCRAPAGSRNYLRVTGANTRNIRLFANDLAGAARAFTLAPEVSATDVIQQP